jgi:hypothetical protein
MGPDSIPMAFEKTCDNNENIDKDYTASFNSPPTEESSLMTTKTYKIANCELDVFNVSQDLGHEICHC